MRQSIRRYFPLIILLSALPAVVQAQALSKQLVSLYTEYEANILDNATPAVVASDSLDRAALLIGISDYPGSDEDLEGPELDVHIMETLLMANGNFKKEDIVVLKDEMATRDNIANQLQRLSWVRESGVVVVYFSGHGIQLDYDLYDQDERIDGKDEAIVVYDASNEWPLIVDDEWDGILNYLNKRRMLVILDSCYSGTATRGLTDAYAKYSSMEISRSSQLEALASNSNRSDRFVFSASQSDEVSWSRWFPDFDNFAGLATVAFASTWLEAGPKTTMQELFSESRRIAQQLSLDMSSIQTPDFEVNTASNMTVEDFFK